MPATDGPAGCQCTVSMATDFSAEFIVWRGIVFSFLMSAHIRNSSQLTQGTVIEAAEGFLESLFFFFWANSEPIVRETESEDQ